MEKRILLDTSVYGKLVDDTLLFALLLERRKNNEFIIYGNELIRKELRATPKSLLNKTKEKKVRLFGLSLYSSLITKENHVLKINSLMENLAKLYYQEYRKGGGNFSALELHNDFLMVSCATLHQLDLVVSDDRRTMFSDGALHAYEMVNHKMGFRNPDYLLYNVFREKILKKSGI
ncbi:hypothetical protein HZC31_01230 [Candidatus Woesearchaeota archaeon]|nr:hypothetical protein [Candidatus Woesearchaeota archaeon]